MSALAELTILITAHGLALETGVFSGKAPDEYLVLTPLSDTFAVHADNVPRLEVQEVRLSLFAKGNYTERKNQLAAALLGAEFTLTDRRYIGYEDFAGYHHYVIDVAKEYELQED